MRKVVVMFLLLAATVAYTQTSSEKQPSVLEELKAILQEYKQVSVELALAYDTLSKSTSDLSASFSDYRKMVDEVLLPRIEYLEDRVVKLKRQIIWYSVGAGVIIIIVLIIGGAT